MTSKLSILIIDSNQRTLGQLGAIFEGHRYQVIRAGTLDQVRQALNDDPPAIMIINIYSVGTKYLPLIERFQYNSQWKRVPIVVVAPPISYQERISYLKVGILSFLSNPIYPQELLLRVENILSLVASHDADAIPPELKEEVLALLQGKLPSVVPEVITGQEGGIRYPESINAVAESAGFEVGDVLDCLFQQGLLKRRLHNMVYSCPRCQRSDVGFMQCCSKCGSIEYERGVVYKHLTCGIKTWVGNQSDHLAFFCSKCGNFMEDKEIAVMHVLYRCTDCGKGFRKPRLKTRCFNCQTDMGLNDLIRQPVYQFELTETASEEKKSQPRRSQPLTIVHSKPPSLLREALRAAGMDFLEPAAFSRQLKHELQRAKLYETEVSLLGINWQSTGPSGIGPDRRQALRGLKHTQLVLSKCLRKLDIMGIRQGKTQMILMPDTPASMGRIMQERIETALQGGEKSFAAEIGLASFPNDGVEAEILIDRCCKTATALAC